MAELPNTTSTTGGILEQFLRTVPSAPAAAAAPAAAKKSYTSAEVGAALLKMVSAVAGGATAWVKMASTWLGDVTIEDRFTLYMCLGDYSFSIEESKRIAAANKESQIKSLTSFGYGSVAATSAPVRRIDAHLAQWCDFLARRSAAPAGIRPATVWYTVNVQSGMKEFFAQLDTNNSYKKGVRLSRRYWWRQTAVDLMPPFVASLRLYRAVANNLVKYGTQPTQKQIEAVRTVLAPLSYDFTDPTFSSSAQFSRDERPKGQAASREYKEWIELMASFMHAVSEAYCATVGETFVVPERCDKDDNGYKQYKRAFHFIRWNIKNYRFHMNGNTGNRRGPKVGAYLPLKPNKEILSKL